MITLNDDRQRRVERVLLCRGEVCPQCDFLKLSSDATAMQTMNNISVRVSCTNRSVEHPKGFAASPSLRLTDDEAREVGINPR